jgi:23S rRNA pseudouridine2605 synthase/23S rRNA pseudouridine2604 synthase
MDAVRLQKFLSQAGVCSRRQGERLIIDGRVAVNGNVVTELGTRIHPEHDQVAVDGAPVRPSEERIYLILNKPLGYVTSCHQPGERLVTDLVDIPERLFPVGRLDKDSTGLLLLTNDGRIHHRLSHPSFDHEKEYDITVDAPIAGGALKKLAAGVNLKGRRTRPARVRRLGPDRFRMVLQEGRNRQIRRMVQKVGSQVRHLHRIRVSHIRLGKLPEGKWRSLTEPEIRKLIGSLESP